MGSSLNGAFSASISRSFSQKESNMKSMKINHIQIKNTNKYQIKSLLTRGKTNFYEKKGLFPKVAQAQK